MSERVFGWRVSACVASLALFLAWAGAGSPWARGEDWPQFRGVNSSGVTTSSARLPVEFSFEHKMRWQAPLGDGVS